MIKIKLGSNGSEYFVEMVGHAGFSPGNDIVCAAASMMVQALHASVLKGIGGSKLVGAEFASGRAVVRFCGGKELFEMTQTGFEMLEKSYKDYVSVQRREDCRE